VLFRSLVIIDDLDNINEQSQQVFRNYIDKYRHNSHFIAVCTNLQKVIESIQSKLHILRISIPTPEKVKEVLNNIVQKEQITMDEESKDYLIVISGGSIRILINFLEKIYILGEPVDLDLCKRICSSISIQEFETYLKHIQNNDILSAIEVLYRIYDFGYSVIDILDYFFCFIKMTNMLDEETKYRIIPYLCKYITIFHNIHEDGIELALLTNNLQKIIFEKK